MGVADTEERPQVDLGRVGDVRVPLLLELFTHTGLGTEVVP